MKLSYEECEDALMRGIFGVFSGLFPYRGNRPTEDFPRSDLVVEAEEAEKAANAKAHLDKLAQEVKERNK
jgi:hypothetical protein